MDQANRASDSYIKQEALDKETKTRVVKEERDGGWIISKMVHDKGEDVIERLQQVQLKFKLSEDSYTDMRLFTEYTVKGFNIICGKRWIYKLNGLYDIDHKPNASAHNSSQLIVSTPREGSISQLHLWLLATPQTT
jgi:hypothetical protein